MNWNIQQRKNKSQEMNSFYDELKGSIITKILNAEKQKMKINTIYNDNNYQTMNMSEKSENLIVMNIKKLRCFAYEFNESDNVSIGFNLIDK